MWTRKAGRAAVAVMLGAVFGVAGCGGGGGSSHGGVTHTLVANIEESIPAGVCSLVEGPYTVPSGTDMAYAIDDSFGDDMDIAIVLDGTGCDPAGGYAYTSGVGSVTAGETVPGDTYDLAIGCFNAVEDCTPTVAYWTADY